jgi:preprotein translocase subunit SecA
MQIIGPDGTPIETAEQMQQAQMQQAQAQQARPPAPSELPSGPPRQLRRPPTGQASLPMDLEGDGQARAPVPIQNRAPSTTIDELEREFQRKKKRELEQARAAGSSSTNGNAPRVTGEKVGRNDPCPCGSGKKYKKCHGAQA